MSNLQQPGEAPARSDEYLERGPCGGDVPNARQVTIEPGDGTLPPTSEEGNTWECVGPPKA